MDVDGPLENGIDEIKSKRVCVTLEPLPEKRIYRIDELGNETYEEETSTEARLKLVAQLIHEPELPQVDQTRINVDRDLKNAMNHMAGFKNLANLLANEQHFSVFTVEAPSLTSEELQHSAITSYQSRQNQLKKSAEILVSTASKLRSMVSKERTFYSDLKTLGRSRWKLQNSDLDSRQVWNEPSKYIAKRINISYSSVSTLRNDEGVIRVEHPHVQTGLDIQVDSHDHRESSKLYHAHGIKMDASDLYKASSNTYTAEGLEQVHKLLLNVSKSMEDAWIWGAWKQRAAMEGIEVKDDEIILEFPNSPVVYSIKAIKPKNNMPRKHQIKSESETNKDQNDHQSSDDQMAIDNKESDSEQKNPKKRKFGLLYEVTKKQNKFIPSSINTSVYHENSIENSSKDMDDQEQDKKDRASMNDFELNKHQPNQDIISTVEQYFSDFDDTVVQDLILITLKQAYFISQNGTTLDQSRYPLYPMRRYVARPIIHSIFEPVMNVCYHFKQIMELSKLLDDFCFAFSRKTSNLGSISCRWYSKGLATSNSLSITFCTYVLNITIRNGLIHVSKNEFENVFDFMQFLIADLSSYIISSVYQHAQALIGPHSPIKKFRKVTFPIGVEHPLKNPEQKEANFLAHFEIMSGNLFPIQPSLVISSRVPGVVLSKIDLPIQQNIWKKLKGKNFVDKITSLIINNYQIVN